VPLGMYREEHLDSALRIIDAPALSGREYEQLLDTRRRD